MICGMTYLGQSVNLTLSDLSSKLTSDFSGSLNIWIESSWREKRDGGKIISLYHNSEEVIEDKLSPRGTVLY